MQHHKKSRETVKGPMDIVKSRFMAAYTIIYVVKCTTNPSVMSQKGTDNLSQVRTTPPAKCLFCKDASLFTGLEGDSVFLL